MKEFDTIAHEVEEGNLDALTGFVQLHKIMKLAEKKFSRIKELALDEAAKHGQKEFVFEGVAKIRLSDGRRTFNFKGIPAWAKTKHELEGIEKQAKADYAAYESGKRMMATNDGEEIILPEVNYSKPSIAVTHLT